MKICIYGAGAVGGHFAARLAQAGEDVSIIARGPHLEAVQQNGLKLLLADETIHVRLKATHDPSEIGKQEVVIVTLKGPSLPGIVDQIKALLDDETAIVFAMNGIPWWYFYGIDRPGEERRIELLDPGSRWWKEIGPKRAVGGVVYSANIMAAPGVIRNNSIRRNLLIIGEPDGSVSARCGRINSALGRAGLAGPAVEDIRNRIWAKLLGNIAFAPICTLTASTISAVVTDEALRALCIEIMKEAVAIAEALGLKLDIDLEERVDGGKRMSAHKPSMLQDFELKRPLEIPSILTAPQAFARMTGVPTPRLDTLIALLKRRVRSAGLDSG